MASLIKNMAEPFSATKEYEYGQNVTFQKQPYQRINPLTGSGPWNADDWKPLFLTDMTSGNTVEGDNCLYVAPEYDPEQEEPYNTDDTVLHLGLLHKCKEDNVSGPWDESKWERILLTDVGDLPSNLGGKVASNNKFYLRLATANSTNGITIASNIIVDFTNKNTLTYKLKKNAGQKAKINICKFDVSSFTQTGTDIFISNTYNLDTEYSYDISNLTGDYIIELVYAGGVTTQSNVYIEFDIK